MQDSLVAGRRTAVRLAAIQAAITVAVALAFLVQSTASALAALVGGGSVSLGTALMGWRAFRGGVAPAGVALLRLAGGLALKWLVIGLAVMITLTRTELPPLPMLAGLGAALVGFVLGGLMPGRPFAEFRIKS